MQEKKAWKINGFIGLLLILLLGAAAVYFFISCGQSYDMTGQLVGWKLGLGILFSILLFVPFCGMIIVQPNRSAVVTFFGKYSGEVKESGFWMIKPFSSVIKVSLRVRNFNSEKIKVNDVGGNPIEIAAVIVFKIANATKAVFDVDKYEQFIETQSETAVRHVAAQYPYDDYEGQEISLRANSDVVSAELLKELQDRLVVAGVEVIEVRLTHLAYATEIASAMLQRQQASAILAARQIIVEGAVGMAQLAIDQLEKNGTLNLDPERRANMVNNVLVSIIADRSSQPVINVGSLY